ncbi:MAG: ABC transporter substrate-binding protein [Actinomycetota bacterium]
MLRNPISGRARHSAALVLALGLISSACGGGGVPEPGTGAAPASSSSDAFPVTVAAANGKVTIDARPERIVSLSATATEMLFAIGAGDQVEAVDNQSDYPPDVPTTELSGYEPNVEAIAGYEPDLVVASSDAGLKSLAKVGIPLIVHPAVADFDEAYAQFEQLGLATGHVSEAEAEVDRIRTEIEEITSTLPSLNEKPTYYHELDQTYFSVTSKTFIGRVYELAGLENIADKADKAGTGYPQLSAEYIIDADPDFIFLADSECCGQTPAKVSSRPGWSQITAVRSGAVFDVGDDISSRWGPRIVDFLEIVVDAIKEVQPAA